MTIDKGYEVVFPKMFDDIVKFSFVCTTKDGAFTFIFQWFNNKWNCWSILPSGEQRDIGIFKSNMNWSGYTDFHLFVDSTIDPIGLGDLDKVSMYILKMKG